MASHNQFHLSEDDDKKRKKRWGRGVLGRGVVVDFFAFIMVCVIFMMFTNANNTNIVIVADDNKGNSIDAVVFIVMGDLAAGPAASNAVESLRLKGDWSGPIVIYTDHVKCLAHLNSDMNFGVSFVEVKDLPRKEADPEAWLLAVKAVKCRVLELLTTPESSNWQHLLYLDVDVWVSNPISKFIADLPPASGSDWVTLFADCNGHAIGWCSGCNAWNTGVMVYSRQERTDHCLNEWKNMLLRGDYPTDQEALEHVARDEICSGISVIPHPMTHLLFLKDYLALPFTVFRWPTFIHVTSSNRIETQDVFYRQVASWVHRSLNLQSKFTESSQLNAEACS